MLKNRGYLSIFNIVLIFLFLLWDCVLCVLYILKPASNLFFLCIKT